MKITGLSYIYDVKGVKTHALHDISLSIKENSIVAIMGKSGMGKTTLLKCLAGILPPATGSILVDDFEISGATEEELANYRLKTIGLMYQDYNLVDFLTIFENIALPLMIAGISKNIRSERINQLLQEFEIKQYSNRFPYQLSGGEKQRVALCVALANDPKILLCDEPTGALDHENSIKMYEYLRNQKEEHGKTIIIVSHDTAIKQFVDRVYDLSRDSINMVENNAESL